MKSYLIIIIYFLFIDSNSYCQLLFSKQDSIRGSITPERSWWDVKKYDLEIETSYSKKEIQGKNIVSFFTVKTGQKMQIDLQEPMEIDSIQFAEEKTTLSRTGNVYYINFENELK